MYVRKNGRRRPDDFSHEQSLVLDTKEGLVIFNSCSHGGADVIIREAEAAFPGKQIYGLIGGFHLFRSEDQEVRELADRIRKTGIRRICTGHCTVKGPWRSRRKSWETWQSRSIQGLRSKCKINQRRERNGYSGGKTIERHV